MPQSTLWQEDSAIARLVASSQSFRDAVKIGKTIDKVIDDSDVVSHAQFESDYDNARAICTLNSAGRSKNGTVFGNGRASVTVAFMRKYKKLDKTSKTRTYEQQKNDFMSWVSLVTSEMEDTFNSRQSITVDSVSYNQVAIENYNLTEGPWLMPMAEGESMDKDEWWCEFVYEID